jgi:hypothetical protein
VHDLVRARIERALRRRSRYRYVQPRVVAAREGWRVHSPNCSRNIAADGAEIPIAWLRPGPAGRWALHAWDHAAAAWSCRGEGLSLVEALDCLCEDPLREFWP